MKPGTRWTLAIVGLLGGNLIAMGVLATTATRGSAQVIDGYYDKAVHYDDTMEEAERSKALGWSTDLTFTAETIEVRAHGATGAPLVGARVRVEGRPRAHAVDVFSVELVAIGGDLYRAQLPGRHLGWHDVTIHVEVGGAQFTRRLAIEAR